MEIGPLVPEILKGFCHIYRRDSHLGHVTQMPQSFVPHTHRGSVHNLSLIGQEDSEKQMFEHCGQRVDNKCWSMGIL